MRTAKDGVPVRRVMRYYYNMNIIPALKPLTMPEFLDWAQSQAKGRYELIRGKVVAMAPERAAHVRAKQRIFLALRTRYSAAVLLARPGRWVGGRD